MEDIPVEKDETADKVFSKAENILKEACPNLSGDCTDRAHRVGRDYKCHKTNKTCRSVIVRFTSFEHRTSIYRNRNILKDVKVKLDLARYIILSLTRYIILLDVPKAFDKVWHDGLIYKLQRNGINGDLLRLIESFLSNKYQRVVLNGQTSNWNKIKTGVPQGSILGPLFFLIYINDLPSEVLCSAKLFADDTSLFSVVENVNETTTNLNKDLENINKWTHQ